MLNSSQLSLLNDHQSIKSLYFNYLFIIYSLSINIILSILLYLHIFNFISKTKIIHINKFKKLSIYLSIYQPPIVT